MAYNVFIDTLAGQNVTVLSRESAYEASALANYAVDAGFRVETDLWDATLYDAMLSPAMHALVCRGLVQYTLTYTLLNTGGLETPKSRSCTASAVATIGRVLMSLAGREAATDIAVRDSWGKEITFEFPVFCV